MESAVERVIATMWDRYHEPLSLADMADTAIFSRFYFSRVFRSVTGTSPGRFLTAIRLYKAKNLLLQTSASVTEVSYLVGYNSPGTFSSRFTRSVGMVRACQGACGVSACPILLAAGGTGGHLFPPPPWRGTKRRGYEVEPATDERAEKHQSEFPARAIHCVPSATFTSRSPLAGAKTFARLFGAICTPRNLLSTSYRSLGGHRCWRLSLCLPLIMAAPRSASRPRYTSRMR